MLVQLSISHIVYSTLASRLTYLFSKSFPQKFCQSFIEKWRVLVHSDVLNVPVMHSLRVHYTQWRDDKTTTVRIAFPFGHVSWSPNRNWSTFQTYSHRLIRCVSATAVTHVLFISCPAHWDVPIWTYFLGRKCRYHLHPSREVPVWHTVPLRALVMSINLPVTSVHNSLRSLHRVQYVRLLLFYSVIFQSGIFQSCKFSYPVISPTSVVFGADCDGAPSNGTTGTMVNPALQRDKAHALHAGNAV